VQPFVYSKYKYAISYYLSGWHSRVRSELKVQPFYVDTRDIDICYLFLYFFVFVAFPISFLFCTTWFRWGKKFIYKKFIFLFNLL